MKKGQILVLIILLIIMSVVIWIGACHRTKDDQKVPTETTATPEGSEISLVTPTLPPEPTDPPVATATPTPEKAEFPAINASDFADLSTKAVAWEAGFAKFEDGTTGVWYDTSVDKYVKGYDYTYIKNDSDTVKEIYLTFNISYEKDPLIKILDILKDYNTKNSEKVYVTFFVHSECLDWTDLMRRIDNEGHQIAIRAFPSGMSGLSVKEIETKLLAVEAKFRTIFGESRRMYYYRPGDEFSTREIAVANALGYKVVFHCFKYQDWDKSRYNADGSNGKLNAMLSVLDNFHDGSVIQLTVSELNSEILEKVIEQGQSQGFTFERLDR